MKKIFRLRNIALSLTLIFFIVGGYLGYLAALVDIDEQIFIERVKAVTDKERLEKQLARAKSILDARRRAYLRRSREFILEQQELLKETSQVPLPIQSDRESLERTDETLDRIHQEQDFSQEEEQFFQSLQEERSDLAFFEDEVDTLEQLLAREVSNEDLTLLFSGDRDRRRISDALRRLLQLLDKRRELAEQRDRAQELYSYWERNPKGEPDGVTISVYNKGAGAKDLNPVHITQISTALSIMPQDFDNRLDRLYIVYGDPQMRRGMSGVGVVFMKGEELDFFRVLVHEFGHIFDLHREIEFGDKSPFYDGQYRLYQSDPSVTYYEYSWKNNYDRKTDLSAFASSYGTSDPFEDFAEAFALYVLQGQTFRSWKNDDSVLANKYQYLQNVFNGRTFTSSQFYLKRPYDVTMLEVKYEELLNVEG